MPGFDPTRFPTEPAPATGPPGSYPDRTHTGKRRQACTKDHLHKVTSDLLVARKIEGAPSRPPAILGR